MPWNSGRSRAGQRSFDFWPVCRRRRSGKLVLRSVLFQSRLIGRLGCRFGRAGDPASRLTGERLEKALKKAYVRCEGCKGVLTEGSEGRDDHEQSYRLSE
ncbi:hypothetical protein HMPREF0762_01565 [Slackia exigua ATCC 700122]|uniref:Uncharacterized protein n=1 Tax=Slackia exigua (strain ATCC 700122 / DSM 15923 / CIP 105133 / JCM 11022 / KCTC 5966 / S-7) TaxID=649764 RepID=D0WI93_SLAES|nr:hypothetical protein HMPREF0762_01565 [Slackia exigua ATCC 700122]